MRLDYYKIRIKQKFCTVKFHLSRTDKKGKLLILTFILFEICNFIIFNYAELIKFLEYVEPYIAKNYVSLPMAIMITWIIAYIYHRKNKPIQDFWNTKRQETINDVITFARQTAGDMRKAEELHHQGRLFSINIQNSFMRNNLLALDQIANINYNYLTHKEVRQLRLFVGSIINYFQFLSREKNTQNQINNLETDIVTAENMLVDLIISFKITDKVTIDMLISPLSVYHENDRIRQQREISKSRIQQMLL